MKKQNRVAFFNILSTVLLKGMSIFTAPIFSRLLGTEGYGVVSIYTVWVGTAAIAFSLQSQGTMVNARIEYPEEAQPKYQSSIMTLSLISFLIFGGAILFFLNPIATALRLNRLLVVLIIIQSFGLFCVRFLNSKFTYEFKAGRNVLISVGTPVITMILSLVLVLNLPQEINYYGRIFGLAITYGVLGISACIYILLKGKTFYNREYWTLCLSLALPVVFYNLSDLLLGQCDRVMLQQLMNESMVGQYSLAYGFAGIMFTIFGALNNSWVPFFFDDFKKGRISRLKDQAQNFMEVFTVLSIGFILLGTEVYHIFAAPEFWDGTILIPVFVSSYFLNFLCTFPINFEYYYKKTKVVAVVTIAISLVNLVLNYFLIQRIGIAGAALATMLSHCLQFALHCLYTRYILKAGEYPFGIHMWLKYLVAYAAAMVLVYVTPNAWLIRWGLGAAIGLWELWRIKQRKVLI